MKCESTKPIFNLNQLPGACIVQGLMFRAVHYDSPHPGLAIVTTEPTNEVVHCYLFRMSLFYAQFNPLF